MIKHKILITASGGDAPGVNTYLRGLLKLTNTEIHYSRFGLKGIYDNDIDILDRNIIDDLYSLPSPYIKCGRFAEFENNLEVRKIVFDKIREYDYFIILGGNGSYEAAKIISNEGIKTIFVPLTIDNDVEGTDITLGFLTSLENAVSDVNRVSYTMRAHGYVGLVEIMGRSCPDLTKRTQLYSLAHLCVTNDNLKTPDEFAQLVDKEYKKYGYCVGLIMEKMKYSISDYNKAISKLDYQCRDTSLGHTQRGGSSSLGDLWAGEIFASKTIEAIKKGKNAYISICNQEGTINEF